MKNNLIGCLSAAVLGAAIALSTPAMAFRGGGGFGGMHGGFGVAECVSAAAASLAAVFAEAWSPAGACSSPAETVSLPHPLAVSVSPAADSTTSRSGTASSLGTPVSATLLSLVRLLPWAGAGRTITTMPPMAGAGAKHGPVMAGSGLTSAMIMTTMATEQTAEPRPSIGCSRKKGSGFDVRPAG